MVTARVPDEAPIEAVVLDLFHTLVDPEEFRPPSFHRADHIADRLGVPRAPFADYWASTLPDRLVRTDPPVVEWIRRFGQAHRVPTPSALLEEIAEEIGRGTARALAAPRPEVLRALDELRERGVRVGLLSNCDELEVRGWSTSPLARRFSFVGFSCELGAAKPDPRAYEAVLRGLGGVGPDRAAFAGDGSMQELTGAKRVGFRRVVFVSAFVGHNGLRTARERAAFARQADLTVDRFERLVPALLRRSPSRRSRSPGARKSAARRPARRRGRGRRTD